MALLLFIAAFSMGQEAEHPPIPTVANGEGTDFSTCTACHSDRTEGDTVHPAVMMGCDTCHTVDRYKEETDVYLTAEGNDLCFSCHEDKRPTAEQLSAHWPLRKNLCTTCHDPHSTPTPHLLKRGIESTNREENLCLSCHVKIAEQMEKPVKHAAIEFGCATCHTTHKSQPEGTPEGMYHLTKGAPGLCLDCHDASDGQVQAAHQGQPFGKANCAECHNPHGSDTPKLLNNFIHPPLQMGCETCHLEPQDEQVGLQEGGRRALCLVCHAGVEETIAQATTEHPPATMEDGCVLCHSPHAGRVAKQLRQGTVATCTACHMERGEERVNKQHLHRPVFEIGCAVCHLPHGTTRPHLLRVEGNDLCLACHSWQVQPQLNAGGTLSLFDGAVGVPTESLEGIRLIPVVPGEKFNHPMAGHPVAGTEKQITCLSCHTPHAANGSPKLFRTESGDSLPLCVQCH